MIYDTHCHLNDPNMIDNIDCFLENCKKQDVSLLNVIGYDVESSKKAIEIANKYENCYAVVGMQPEEIPNEEFYEELDALYDNNRIVAVGEIGLDYHWTKENKDKQKEVFVHYIKKAHQLNLPIVVHSRDAHLDTINILKENKEYLGKVVMHCYSYSKEVLKDYLNLGCYISLGGVVTFKNAKVAKEVASVVPLDRLMLETDSPYLTPTPYRGKPNEPSYIRFVLEEIAKLKEMDVNELEDILFKNSCSFFNVKCEK